MIKPRALYAILPFALLGACASQPTARPLAAAPTPTPARTAVEIAPGDSAYGLFLAGQAAVNAGHGDAAAIYFGRAADMDRAGDGAFLESTRIQRLFAGRRHRQGGGGRPDGRGRRSCHARIGRSDPRSGSLVHRQGQASLRLVGWPGRRRATKQRRRPAHPVGGRGGRRCSERHRAPRDRRRAGRPVLRQSGPGKAVRAFPSLRRGRDRLSLPDRLGGSRRHRQPQPGADAGAAGPLRRSAGDLRPGPVTQSGRPGPAGGPRASERAQGRADVAGPAAIGGRGPGGAGHGADHPEAGRGGPGLPPAGVAPRSDPRRSLGSGRRHTDQYRRRGWRARRLSDPATRIRPICRRSRQTGVELSDRRGQGRGPEDSARRVCLGAR